MILENVPASLRGELTRWMLEPRPGIFIGKMSAMVRDKLWEKASAKARDGGCMLFQSAPNEQGFTIRTAGQTHRQLRDWEGLQLFTFPENTKKSRKLQYIERKNKENTKEGE